MKPNRSARPTLGFLVDWTDNPYQYTILQGVAACAAERDVNLVCFEGGALHCPLYVSGSASLNAPYDLAGPETVDGLVILAVSIGRYCTPRQLLDFCARYRPLPMVATGCEVDGVPSVVIDNEAGFVQLLEHLLRDHEYTRIAFVNGMMNNPDAIQRRTLFERTLRAHGIPTLPELLVDGDFMPDSGAQAVATLLDERKVAFDVLVAANDYMAIGATQELTRRGIAVPVDVAVTGFDDLDLSSTLDPPLTTVAQPLREQGRIACEMVLDLLAGREVPERRVLPTNLVIRDSCWQQCSLTARATNEWRSSSAPQPSFARIRSEALAAVAGAMQNRCQREELGLLRDLAEQLLEAVQSGWQQGSAALVLAPVRRAVDAYLTQSTAHVAFHSLVTVLRRSLIPMVSEPEKLAIAEEVFYQSVVCFGKKSWQLTGSHYEHVVSVERDLTEFRTDLSLTLELENQLEIVAKRLPQVGITRGLVFLYAGDTPDPYAQAKLLLAFDSHGRHTVDPEQALQLPAGLKSAAHLVNSSRVSFIVEPMGDVGFLVLQMTDDLGMKIYVSVRDIVSFAMRSSILLQEVRQQKDSLKSNLDKLQRAMEGFIETMGLVLEARDPYTAGHQRRVADLARSIAREMGLPAQQTDWIGLAGMIHDIGKIGLPSEILNKPGKLQELEYSLLKTHAAVAYDVLKNVDFPWPIADIVHQHHERLDGSGYPLGLSGDSIRIEARILAVADVVEAMASHRPYRPALGLDRALEEITEHRGTRYDPNAVDVCLRLFNHRGYRLRDFSRPT